MVHVILTVLRVPMARKYGCPALAIWRRSVHTFVSIVHATVKGMSLHTALSSADSAVAKPAGMLWELVIETLETALFADVAQPAELSADEKESDAGTDITLARCPLYYLPLRWRNHLANLPSLMACCSPLLLFGVQFCNS